MPIVAFNSVTDGVEPHRRSREHFITNTDLEDSGHWRYLEHDWIAKPGTYIYEPAGEAHTLVITEDSPEPMVAVFVVEGGLIFLDKGVNGGFAAYEDGFSLLELSRKHYREVGLDVGELDKMVR